MSAASSADDDGIYANNACDIIKINFNRTVPDDMPIIRDTSIALSVIAYLYCFVSFFRFCYYRNSYDHLKKRSILYAWLTTLGVLIQLTSGVLFVATNYVCWVVVSLSMLVVPVAGVAVPLKMLDHFTKYVYARGILGLDKDAGPEASSADSGKNDTWLKATSTVFSFVFSVIVKKSNVHSSNQVTDVVPNNPNSLETRKPKPISMKSIMLLKFLTSSYARLGISALCLLPFILIVIVDLHKYDYLHPANQCYGCTVNSDQSNAIFIGGGIIISLGLVVAFIVRKYPDPFGIMTECRMSMLYGGLTAILGFYLTVVYPDGYFKTFTFSYVAMLGMLILQFITTDYQLMVARKNQKKIAKWAKGRNIKSLSPASVTGTEADGDENRVKNLKELLLSPEAANFEEYLVGEYSIELIRMYQDCRYYEEHYYDMNESTKRAKVKRIIALYISSNSALEVNLPHAIKEAIKNAAESSEAMSQTLFKDSQNEILLMLFGPWRRYLAHQDKKKDQQGNP